MEKITSTLVECISNVNQNNHIIWWNTLTVTEQSLFCQIHLQTRTITTNKNEILNIFNIENPIKEKVPVVRLLEPSNPNADNKGFISIKITDIPNSKILEMIEHYNKQYFILQMKLDKNICLNSLYADEADKRNLTIPFVEYDIKFEESKCITYA